MKIILDNYEPPLFKTFNDIAIPTGILQSNFSSIDKWLASNFVGLHFRLWWYQFVFNIDHFYKWDCFTSKWIVIKNNTLSNFLDMIKYFIQKGNYIYCFVNEFFIPDRYSYGKTNFIHDLCIYGFDDTQEVFYVSAYNDKHQYVNQQINYKQLYIAYKNFHIPIRQLAKIKWKNRFIVFKPNIYFDFQSINDEKVKKDIYRYCLSEFCCSGMYIYKFIERHINKAKNKSNLDLKYFSILKEHVTAIYKLGYPEIDYEKNCKIANKIFLYALKFTITKNINLLVTIRKDLLVLHRNEIVALEPYFMAHFNGLKLKKFKKKYNKYLGKG